MKYTLLIIAFVISSPLLFSQSTYFDITESKETRDINNTSTIEAISISADGEIATASTGKKKLIFDIYDSEANKMHNQFTVLEKKETVVGNLISNDIIKVFTVYRPKKTEREIRCYIFNVEEKSIQVVELFKTTVEKTQSLFSGQNKRQTNFATSPDGKYVAVATDNIKRNSNSYIIHVYNSETMELAYTQTFFENPDNYYESFDMAIDDSGMVYSVGKEYKKGRSERGADDTPNYAIIINKVSETGTTTNRVALTEDQHIADLKIIQKQNQLHLYGFYSTKVAGRISGLSKFVVDKGNIEVVETKQTKLPESVLEDIYSSEKVEAKKDKELNNYYLDYLIEDENGNTTLLAEQFFVTQTYMYNQYGGYTMTTYHYNNILILNLDPEGELKWGRSIFKTSGVPSYNAFVMDNKLHVLLNTGKKLKEKDDGRVKAKTGWFQSTALFDFVYDENGEVTQEKIRENKGSDIYHPYSGFFNNRKFIMLNASNEHKKAIFLEAKK